MSENQASAGVIAAGTDYELLSADGWSLIHPAVEGRFLRGAFAG